MIRPLSFVVASSLGLLVALASPGCAEDEPEDDAWSHTITEDELTLASLPTMTLGNVSVTSWTVEMFLSKNSYGHDLSLRLRGKDAKRTDGTPLLSPGNVRLDFHADRLAPQTFTTYRVLQNSAGGAPVDGLDLTMEDAAGDFAARAEGAIVLEAIDLQRRGTDDATANVRVRFEDVKFITIDDDSSPPREFTTVISGTLDATGKDVPPPPLPPPAPPGPGGGSSGGGSSGGGSSGGGSCGTEVWTCPFDGQATPTCQYACTFAAGSSQRQQSCAVLRSMLESGNTATCCGSICP